MKNSLRQASVVALCACLGCVAVSCGPRPSTAQGKPGTKAGATNSNAAKRVSPAFSKLLGKWQRPDGGYILQLKTVDDSGSMEASYFNPAPIRVSKARAIEDAGEVKAFVELNDINYPGCTYSLKYDSKFDQLYGEYYQAALGQRYDVTFARLKEE